MRTVRELLEQKGHEIFSVAPDTSVFDAIKLMADKGVGALVVLEGGKLAGILSERDYARKVILMGRSSRETPVRDIMTSRVVCAHPDRQIDECMAVMTDKRIRHLPIHDGEKLVGVVSIGDLVKTIIAEQKFVIAQLESYISGG